MELAASNAPPGSGCLRSSPIGAKRWLTSKHNEVLPVREVPKIELFFEWGGGVPWCANGAAHQRFDVGSIEEKLSLPNEIRERLHGMAVWLDTALDWNNPPGT